MNLIPSGIGNIYVQEFVNIHDTFARNITCVKSIKRPITSMDFSDANQDYNFVFDKDTDNQPEFEYDMIETLVSARIKYIDKQDKEFALILSRNDGININQEFGFIRIKVPVEQCDLVNSSTRIIVDGFNTNIFYRDRRHGLLDLHFCTFYLQRTP